MQFRKLWPVSLVLVDLPSSEMQKSCNLILEGAVECSENPSTLLWNAIFGKIRSDVEAHTGRVGIITYDCKITTCCADQPAKRSFFGMKGHSSKVIAPYNTPIDILHNTGEGLFDRIRKV
ncbi:Protein CBG11214 [Caenorhabditis briggsae]|uniref:Protein CBG11214 n=1 Tax=Caenorhabditis briggsae TaxID=6238 RepID=A8XCQ7_CAEBR|nr:Protein CBG11214 [Caenorhabditis briggsae]CAP30406.1 Protein CBG11214 [Caenorhabditis briggsae]